jgi:basic membrane protein A
LAGLVPLVVLGACGSPAPPPTRKTIGFAYALGGKDDRSYNAAAAQSHTYLRRRFEIQEYAPLTPEEYGTALTTIAAGPAELIFCVGYIYDTYVNQIARHYPNKWFCVFDGAPSSPAGNAFGVQFRVSEASALAGVVAADRSRSNILGFVGGSDIPPIAPFADGFEAGAQRLKPTIRLLKSYIGSGAEAFTNAARGRDHALRLMRQGADVLFHAAGTSGDGVIGAAQDEGRLAIGVDVNQTALAPRTVITNVLKRLDVAAIRIANEFGNGRSRPSATVELGLAEDGVGITPPVGISREAATLIDALRAEYRGSRG